MMGNYIYVLYLCIGRHTWRSEENVWEFVFSLYPVGPQDQTYQAWQQEPLTTEPSHRPPGSMILRTTTGP